MSKEVIKGTDTIISCFITGLKIQANVTWLDSTNEAVSGPQFSSKEGFLENKQQIAQLKVAGSEVYADKSYTCRVTKTFNINDESESSDTVVDLYVYGEITDYMYYSKFKIGYCITKRYHIHKDRHYIYSRTSL